MAAPTDQSQYSYETDSLPVQKALSEPRQPFIEDFPWLMDINLSDWMKEDRWTKEEVLPTRGLDGTLSVEVVYHENRYLQKRFLPFSSYINILPLLLSSSAVSNFLRQEGMLIALRFVLRFADDAFEHRLL